MLQLTSAGRGTLDPALLDLVKIRASQLNGCAFCLDMHTKDARHRGESDVRLDRLAAWREAPGYSPQERAAFSLCESMTRVEGGVADVVLEEAEEAFAPEDLATLMFAIVAINAWNRLMVASRAPAGGYEP